MYLYTLSDVRFTSMKNSESILVFQRATWRFWGGTDNTAPPCLVCWKPAVCLHEIIPRSLYRDWFKDITNSVPVCNECHLRIHEKGDIMREDLQKKAADRAAEIDNEYLDWEDENPARRSKSARQKMGMDGRSVLTLADEIRKRAKK